MTAHMPRPEVEWPSHFSEVPKDIFHRRDVYRAELENIFHGPEWHPLAHVAEVPKPGDFKSMYIGESPVLIVHGEDGRIRVFENACTHRGTQLKTSARGHAKEIECPYHRWLFSTTGKLLGCPGKSDFPDGFDPKKYPLRELRSDSVFGLIFATYSPTVTALRDYLGETTEYIGRVVGGDGRLKLIGYQKVNFSSNWKAYADNEGYHAPLLHTAFRLLQWRGGAGRQIMTKNAHKVIQVDLNVPKPGFLTDHSLVEARDPKTPPQSVVVSLFPISIILRHLDVINIRYAVPRSENDTEVHYAYFAHEDDKDELIAHRVQQSSNLLGPSGLISLEDGAVFNRLHVGAHTTGNVTFQKGVGETFDPNNTSFKHNDEAGNLVRWARYREAMGF